mmetsp:Transcript_31129/g.100562  ORF Transcript_31129/g.100562 Transcript_31129/m.100562 type:complete len:239 (-) Transcript_31129:196-912(-)
MHHPLGDGRQRHDGRLVARRVGQRLRLGVTHHHLPQQLEHDLKGVRVLVLEPTRHLPLPEVVHVCPHPAVRLHPEKEELAQQVLHHVAHRSATHQPRVDARERAADACDDGGRVGHALRLVEHHPPPVHPRQRRPFRRVARLGQDHVVRGQHHVEPRQVVGPERGGAKLHLDRPRPPVVALDLLDPAHQLLRLSLRPPRRRRRDEVGREGLGVPELRVATRLAQRVGRGFGVHPRLQQ